MLANDNLWTFLSSIPWWSWIPIVAIVGGVVQSIIGMNQKHRERLEMIQRGMDPRKPK
jgi:hypothetical protein